MIYVAVAVVAALGVVLLVALLATRGKRAAVDGDRAGAGASDELLSAAPTASAAEEVTSAPKSADFPKPAPRSPEPARAEPAEVAAAPVADAPPQPARAGRPTSEAPDADEPTGPQARILVTAMARTDPGKKRDHNEDAYTVLEDHNLVVIADGMGRHAAGEVASQLCVQAISEAFRTGRFGDAPTDPALPKRANRIRSAILDANDRILRASRLNDDYRGMGTTVVAAYFSPSHKRVFIASAGDSRCYRLRGEALEQLTVDHTLGAAMGITQGKTAAMLSRAVGIEEDLDVDVQSDSPEPGDVYLLCSDGLSRMVSDDEIRATLLELRDDLDAATRRLIDLANERGGRDNITAALVRVDDTQSAA